MASQMAHPSTSSEALALALRDKQPYEEYSSSDSNSENGQVSQTGDRGLETYAPYVQQQAAKMVNDIVASIYYDINYLCILRNSASLDITPEKVASYRLQFIQSAALLDLVVGRVISEKYRDRDPRGTVRRLEEFTDAFGWKMLAICVTAEGFRRACREIRHNGIWAALMDKIGENRWSIEVFARARNLDWRGPLLKYADLGIPRLDAELAPMRKVWEQHPHNIVMSLDKKLKRPWFEDFFQVHIDEPLFDPCDWPDPAQMDPTERRPTDGDCDLCGSIDMCDCELDFSAGSLVEMIERPVTGTGVRALSNFKKGDILGQFLGQLFPPDYDDDEVYSLLHQSKTDMDGSLATISPRRYGNWTRYIAHSCKASLTFACLTVGRRTVMAVMAVRDIAAFEDLTVDYGPVYWTKQACMCGEEKCVSRKL
ncbi:hypothetical protein BDV18DRAFT_133155 [Aspergillus unguis]